MSEMRYGQRHEDAAGAIEPVDALMLVEKAFVAHDATTLLHDLRQAEVDCWLVGGAVRDSIVGLHPPNDIDLVVPNGEQRVHDLLSTYGPSRRNRHGNYRYQLHQGSHVDVIEPRYFYHEFDHVADVVAYFDTSANALGIQVSTGYLLDPVGGLGALRAGTVRLSVARWTGMSDFESVHLVLRTLRLLQRIPLRVENPWLLLGHVTKFDVVDWRELERLNGFGQREAVRRLLAAAQSQGWGGYTEPV